MRATNASRHPERWSDVIPLLLPPEVQPSPEQEAELHALEAQPNPPPLSMEDALHLAEQAAELRALMPIRRHFAGALLCAGHSGAGRRCEVTA